MLTSVAQTTRYDEEVCDAVRSLGYKVSPGEIRTLREIGVIEVIEGHRGGRGKAKRYAPGTAHVVAAVQAAKTHPSYARKMCRAVLMAWVRGASIRTGGLRWAFREYYEDEERTDRHLLEAKRVIHPGSPAALTQSVDRALAAARQGWPLTGHDLAELERLGNQMFHETPRSGQGDVLPGRLDDGYSLGLVEYRADGTVRATELGREVWARQGQAPFRRIAKEAPRQELDAARDQVRPMMRAAGFQPDDLVVASCTPGTVLHLRKAGGPDWWRRYPRSDRRRS
jgi:hypothetical protein